MERHSSIKLTQGGSSHHQGLVVPFLLGVSWCDSRSTSGILWESRILVFLFDSKVKSLWDYVILLK